MYWNLYDRPLSLRENAHLVDVVYFKDGLNSTISVAKTEDYISLRTNGKVDASNHDVVTQLLVGHLGALAHPPRRVLLIGFGSGMTASALAGYTELERLDIVEIEPAVMGAAPLLTQLNRNVLHDPRVHVTLDDARNFLFTTRDRYDLIISEPSNPWIAGVATLFTREFYRAVQARLVPGGVFVQWVQAYSLYPEDLKMLVATFLGEFHGATLWHGDAPDLILMAPSPPSGEIFDRARNLYDRPRLQEDFQQLGMEKAAGLFGFYLLDDAGLRKFASGARINTDDLTLLEYHAPRKSGTVPVLLSNKKAPQAAVGLRAWVGSDLAGSPYGRTFSIMRIATIGPTARSTAATWGHWRPRSSRLNFQSPAVQGLKHTTLPS